MYDLIIIGGGPAGIAAAIYSARKKLNMLIITDSFGGQSIVSDDIQNWIGEQHISGVDLAQKLEDHIRAYEDDIDIEVGKRVRSVEIINDKDNQSRSFEVETEKGKIYKSKAIILAVGGRRRKLKVPGEKKFEGKGVTYCSICDAPLFRDKAVVVIGGGNAGVEAVVDLLPYAEKIYLLEVDNKLRADQTTQEKIKREDKVEIILNANTKKIPGEIMVDGLIYEDENEKEQKLAVQGVFVEIGSVPSSEIVRDLVEVDKYGQVKTDSKHTTTSQPGIFAAGDVTDDPYKQNNIAVGDGVKAALAAFKYLQEIKKD
jgi:alkyl hydroperoxide reductase subunit F